MTTIAGNIWEQTENHGILKDDHISKVVVEIALKSFTHNYLDLDMKQFILNSKLIKILRKIKKRCLILKPDKGQGIVLISRIDYNNSMEQMFGDASKF